MTDDQPCQFLGAGHDKSLGAPDCPLRRGASCLIPLVAPHEVWLPPFCVGFTQGYPKIGTRRNKLTFLRGNGAPLQPVLLRRVLSGKLSVLWPGLDQ